MKITVQQLRYLLKVAETGSISNAAKTLDAAHGTISEAVNAVEKELGFKVFLRSKKGIDPTDRGIEVLAGARRVVESMDGFEGRFGGVSKRPNSFVVSTQEFKFVIAAFNKVTNALDADQVSYSFNLRQYSKPIDDVYAGIADIGVIGTRKSISRITFEKIEQLGVEYHPLFNARYYAYMDRAHPLARRASVTIDDLAAYPQYSFENFRHIKTEGRPQNATFINSRSSNTMSPDDLMYPDLIPLISDVDGYAIWVSLYPDHAPYERTVLIPIDVDDYMEVGYVLRRGTEPSETVRSFIAELKTFDPKEI